MKHLVLAYLRSGIRARARAQRSGARKRNRSQRHPLRWARQCFVGSLGQRSARGRERGDAAAQVMVPPRTTERLLKLIGRFLRGDLMVLGCFQPSEEGAMQGVPLSPLLANILLDDLDKELEKRGLPFVRYADDFIIFVKSEAAAHRLFGSVERYLQRTLKLVVNREKSCVRRLEASVHQALVVR